MWGYDDGRAGSGDPSCEETPVRNKVDPGGSSRNGTPMKPDAGYSSWGREGKGDSPVCCGGNNDPSDKNNRSATGSTGPSRLPPPCVRVPRKAWGPQPVGEPDPTSFLGQQSATDTEVAVTTPAGILGLLGRARDSLVAGGLRGAFRLLKGFRGEDRRGSGKVTLSGFKAVLGEAELGLGEAEMRILFQVGSNSRRGVPAVLYHSWSRLKKKILTMCQEIPSRSSNNRGTAAGYWHMLIARKLRLVKKLRPYLDKPDEYQVTSPPAKLLVTRHIC